MARCTPAHALAIAKRGITKVPVHDYPGDIKFPYFHGMRGTL